MARNDFNGTQRVIMERMDINALGNWMDGLEEVHESMQLVLTMRNCAVLNDIENDRRIPPDQIFTLLDLLLSTLRDRIDTGIEMIP